MFLITEGLEQVVKELGLYPKENENQHSVGRLVRMTKLFFWVGGQGNHSGCCVNYQLGDQE